MHSKLAIMSCGKDFVSTLNFVGRDDKFKTEKPYTLQYYPTGPLPSRNYDIHHVENIKIEDARPFINSFSLDREGVEVLKLEPQMKYDDYFAEDKLREVYGPQVRKALMDKLGATRVFFHECVVSINQPLPSTQVMRAFTFPIEPYQSFQVIAHCWHNGIHIKSFGQSSSPAIDQKTEFWILSRHRGHSG